MRVVGEPGKEEAVQFIRMKAQSQGFGDGIAWINWI